MRLLIRRDQKEHKGMFGGNKGMLFLLACRAQLTGEEQQLITRYRAEDYALTYRTIGDTQVPGIKIGDLVRGICYELKDIATLLNNEEIIKQACQEFKIFLTVMASFGGEEVIEF